MSACSPMELDENGQIVRRAAAFDDAAISEPIDFSLANQAMIPGGWSRVKMDEFAENWLCIGFYPPGVLVGIEHFVPLGTCCRAIVHAVQPGGVISLTSTLRKMDGLLYCGLRVSTASANAADWRLHPSEANFIGLTWAGRSVSTAAFQRAWRRDGALVQQYFSGTAGWLHCVAAADAQLAEAIDTSAGETVPGTTTTLECLLTTRIVELLERFRLQHSPRQVQSSPFCAHRQGLLAYDLNNADCVKECTLYETELPQNLRNHEFMSTHIRWHQLPSISDAEGATGSAAGRGAGVEIRSSGPEDSRTGTKWVAKCYMCSTLASGPWPQALQEHIFAEHSAELAVTGADEERFLKMNGRLGSTTFWRVIQKPATLSSDVQQSDHTSDAATSCETDRTETDVCAICLQPKWTTPTQASPESAHSPQPAVVELLTCKHQFHLRCIASCASCSGQSLTCPLCRTCFGAKAVYMEAEKLTSAAAVEVAERAQTAREILLARLVARRRIADDDERDRVQSS